MNERPVLPQTHPLQITSPQQAREKLRRIVGAVGRHLPAGAAFVADAGVRPPRGRPETTAAVERVLAETFDAQDAALVQGAGTGAIRTALSAGPWSAGDRRLIVHDAPDYSTTATTFHDGAVDAVRVDFEDSAAVDAAFADASIHWVYVQHTRQRLADAHEPSRIIARAVAAGKRVIVDDNYAVMRTPSIGVELGASASAFSLFKLHGPEGVGVVLGDGDLVDQIRRSNYSGGGQVQGQQALAALQALVMVPLNWAAQAQSTQQLAADLAAGAVEGIVNAQLANAQDLCVIALLDRPVAAVLPEMAAKHGASPFPVGSNSRFEIAPLVYRLSSSTLASRPELRDWALRINPMRADAELTAEILRAALREVD